ncbi:MAG TPA: pyridoxamine 5'-phosphate oxidase [Thermoanaerobaculia bacterium]|nr:pyridoxamine 5'-phosphate oxidase [Thermoanaerobaculia bacterium]
MKISDVRREYTGGELRESGVAPEPIAQFQRWLEEAMAAEPLEPTAMTLATVGPGGRPSARVVLLKGCDERGFVFYTNYGSRKGQELRANPYAALAFYWPALDRQVRIEGVVEPTSRAESEAYFASRPVPSQLGAWASRQSAPVAREELEAELGRVTQRFAGAAVPLPELWGGYRLRPDRIEFWQGRPNRLHDRLVYRRRPPEDGGGAGGPDGGVWTLERLAP